MQLGADCVSLVGFHAKPVLSLTLQLPAITACLPLHAAQLMQLIEPMIVWDHTTGYNVVLEKQVEAQICPGKPRKP
jgi:hypothetical protein